MRLLSFIALALLTTINDGWIDFNKNGKRDIYEDSRYSIDERVEDLLSQMTIEEKSCQLATLYGYKRVLKDSLPTPQWKYEVWRDGIANIDEQLNGVGRGYKPGYHLIYPFSKHVDALNEIQRWFIEQTRLGIPVDFSNEGIHGLNHTKATPLPAPINIGSTWNRDIVRRAGEIVGYEASMLGYTNIYAPILDVPRDPRWGRLVECYGEEPYLIGELGEQMVKGIQSQGVASTLKHFAGYSVPKGGRDAQARTDPHISPRELHEMHLAPFKHVIQCAAPMGVMCSYNDWDGIPVAANGYFLTELLRDDYGFDGYVVSDSGAIKFVKSKHRVAADEKEVVRQVLEAGMNVRTDFSSPEIFIMPIRELLKEEPDFIKVVDARVREVLRTKFRMGLFDKPYNPNRELADSTIGVEINRAFVDQICKESMVLLKNDGVLPLDKGKLSRVLVTGPLASEQDYMTSRYGPNGIESISVLEGITNYLGNGVDVIYQKGCDVVDVNWPDSEIVPYELTKEEMEMIDSAVKAAKRSDVIIAVVGENTAVNGESHSRTSLDLPGRQQLLLQELHKTGKPIVLVMINGRPLTINWADRNLSAILEAWWPCYNGGDVIAKTLFGEYNPGGKLTVTFPKSIGQIEYSFPFKPGSHGIQESSGPNGSGNSRVVGALYPFGYGLSYTKFEYSDLSVAVKGDFSIKVKVKITNVGEYDGDEVVQLYIRDLVSSVIRYDSLLRGFERVSLRAGESRVVEFELLPDDFKFLGKEMNWITESGDYEIMVGASSEDIKLKEVVKL